MRCLRKIYLFLEYSLIKAFGLGATVVIVDNEVFGPFNSETQAVKHMSVEGYSIGTYLVETIGRPSMILFSERAILE